MSPEFYHSVAYIFGAIVVYAYVDHWVRRITERLDRIVDLLERRP